MQKKPMKISTLVAIAKKYDPLITRYARMLTGSKEAADYISIRVLERYWKTNIELPPREMKVYLQWAVKEASIRWKMGNAVWK